MMVLQFYIPSLMMIPWKYVYDKSSMVPGTKSKKSIVKISILFNGVVPLSLSLGLVMNYSYM